MNKRTLTLGGQSYTIEELPARRNAAWRKQLEGKLAPILGIIEQAGAGLELRTNEDLMKVASQVGQLLVTAPDLLIELLFAYSAELAGQQDTILDTAYDSELITAFTAALGMAYPFENLARLATSLASGSMKAASPPTSLNSPSLNGASSVKSLTT